MKITPDNNFNTCGKKQKNISKSNYVTIKYVTHTYSTFFLS